jgi:gliding motility-associated-like protein
MKLKLIFIAFILLTFNSLKANELEKNPPTGCPTLAMSGTKVSCYGGSNGTAAVNVTNGSGSYTYTWSTGNTGVTSLSALPAGTYTVNVKDKITGCSVIGSYVVNSPTAILVTQQLTNVNCFGGTNGLINITVTGGTPSSGANPYTYDWSNNGIGFGDPQDLTTGAGSFSVIVRDNKNCKVTKSYIITQPAQALQTSRTKSDVSCNGGNDGEIDLTVWGGTTPYTYSWSNTAASQDITNLTNGTYNVTVTDAKNCTATNSAVITQPFALSGSLSITDVNCNGDLTGQLIATISNGTAPYTYSWKNTNTFYAVDNAVLSNIPAEDYEMTVVDSKNCEFILTGTVTEPPLLVLTNTFENVKCYGESTGEINLSVSGGTAPFSYNWNTNTVPSFSTIQDLLNIPAENYTVNVTDDKGCVKTLTQEIIQPLAPMSSSFTTIPVDCFGFNTGSIDLIVEGGTNPYTYLWSNGDVVEDPNGLLTGTYTYDALDANNCLLSGSVFISQPAAPLNVDNILTHVNCFGEYNGAIDLTTTGGTSPYSWTWINSTYNLSNTSEDLTNIDADWYSFTTTDGNGCTVIDTLTITQPTELLSTISGTDVSCKFGNDGTIDLTVSGGSPNYTYTWSNSATSQDLSLLIAGIYDVTITDDHNCQTTNQIEILEPLFALSYEYTFKNVNCPNGTDGFIDIEVNGGTSPYTYSWSNGATTDLAELLVAGEYNFIVTDSKGCILEDTLQIIQPDNLTLSDTITDVTCFGLSDGEINITPSGGTQPYTYTWYNSAFALSSQTEDMIAYPSDTYQVEILDSLNCFYEFYFNLSQPELLNVTFQGSDDVDCNGGTDGDIYIDVTGGNGGYTFLWSNGATTEDLIDAVANLYEIVVTDSKNCKDSLETHIYQPDSLLMTFGVTEVSCIDNYDGTIQVYPYGGTGNVTYSWSHGPTDDYLSDLPTATYTVTITDLLNCTATDSVFVPLNTIGCVSPTNAFTPNNDQINDTWFIENMHLYPNAEMKIFNKWGNLLNTQKGYYQPWDGLVNGNDAPSDVYYYILQLNNPQEDKFTGTITIVR